ncbi:glycoside hydrolase family 16 protein [Aquimarina sp. MMG015]|uniref:glycoside hydrolase family 16 protein n=1 Tax=Aquimarina sp. MMG015 TaxID=2822689 RepID=UPI001B3A57B5|nr:glycoside hydrolase family 16 protein [Aquimarina sp. MMG015]MBQ4802562.1 glycoside hydrolase family 16 protein [Aquimarina sp. MMG015]
MKNVINYIFVFMSLSFMSCNEDNEVFQVDRPSNLTFTVDVVGETPEMPNGDGSGMVIIEATATGVVKYDFYINDTKRASTLDGKYTHTFEALGVNQNDIRVEAVGLSGGVSQQTRSISILREEDTTDGELIISGPLPGQALVWSDEFDGGSLDTSNWVFETGDLGVNNELQRYTDRSDNLVVEDGLLKITAKAEQLDGNAYTSARIKTQGKREFRFGTMEARIKLALGQGTWPAFWMLGANIDEVGWPVCGEIDIMEYVGRNPIRTYSNVFFPGNTGADNTTSRSLDVDGLDEGFHVFRAEWDTNKIVFKVDGVEYNTFTITAGLPFRDDFFFILNVAMGGDFGGAVSPDFTEATMEVDYVRVYQ